eukprot:Phypoly_transcript_10341.p1 GENE.Phypoly_transcript_10341~~Phypoly_transcript_10341.p1  ORF type:complete len:342 (-),score=66.08 Phypoly_transcript_10341:132-1157(-)
MLSTSLVRVRLLLRRGLFRETLEDRILRNSLLMQYDQLSWDIEAEKHAKGLESNFSRSCKIHPFIDERVIKQEKKSDGLEEIFSLQNLRLLGTKEGPELAKLQQQLQKHLESIFAQNQASSNLSALTLQNISTTPLNTPSQNTSPQHTSPQIPPQNPLPSQDTMQLTAEDKQEIAKLTDTLPQPKGFLARIAAIFSGNPLSLEEADVATLRNLVQKKQTELDAIRSENLSHNTTQENPSHNTPENLFHNTFQNTTSGHQTTNLTKGTNTNPNNNSVMYTIPAHLAEQIKKRKEMKAAGVPFDQLPKLDLSGVSATTLKQIYQAYQKNKPANSQSKILTLCS